MKIRVLSEKITKIYSEGLIVGFFSDIRPIKGMAGVVDWIYNGIISDLIKSNKVRGILGETTLIASQNKIPASKILLIGLGEKDRYGYNEIGCISSNMWDKLSNIGIRECSIELWGMEDCRLDPYLASKSFMDGLKGYRDELCGITFLYQDKEKAREVGRLLRK